MKGPYFEKYILHYDIVALSETKLNAINATYIPGFVIFSSIREKYKHSSGGGGSYTSKARIKKYVNVVSVCNDNSVVKVRKNMENIF